MASIYRIAQSWTRLKRLSSSSNGYVNCRINYGPEQSELGSVLCRQQGLAERAGPAGRGVDRAELPGGQHRQETTGLDRQAREACKSAKATAEVKGQPQLMVPAVQEDIKAQPHTAQAVWEVSGSSIQGEDQPPIRSSGSGLRTLV